jgi:chromosome segregation ATPase
MAIESGQSHDVDLDRTDKLPILEGVLFDPDVTDDAIRMDHVSAVTGASLVAGVAAGSEFVRHSAVDLPSLAESVRSVEERIARQSAEYEALTRAYERSQAAESAATARANALERDLSAARNGFDAELIRSREFERTLAEKSGSVEAARARTEAALRDSERFQTEARTLRDSLAARDATIVQVLHSLGERDAQLAALQGEHARILPTLETREKTAVQLEADLIAVRAQAQSLSAELKAHQESVATLSAQLKRSESEVKGTRTDLVLAKTHASSYLELLRTREWRRGFDHNLFRELDAKAGAADSVRDNLRSERDQLQGQVSKLEENLAAQTVMVDKLQGAAAAQTASLAQQTKEIQQAEQARAEWIVKLASVDHELTQVRAELATRDQSLAEARSSVSEHLQRVAQLQAEAEAHEEEMTVLMAHLKEARRPIEVIEGDARRLREEVAAKSAAIAELTEEGDKLRAALERTRGQLEEREFLIRRLERSESNNANALGRIQTSMERLGSSAVAVAVAGAAAAPEWTPELIRIDGDRSISHALGRRTRIGRASGCELHIDSSSVSRHHALILAGTREVVIEDLNSTNGVILNGRKVSRQVLSDGDIVTIGEIQFRYQAKPAPTPLKE